MNKEKKFNIKRLLWMICIIEVTILIMSMRTDDKHVANIMHMMTIIPTIIFCICNNSNKTIECIKNMTLYICALVAFIYKHMIGNIQYVIYIIATVVVIILSVVIEKREGRQVTKKVVLKQFFRIVQVLILPITHNMLYGINDYFALVVSITVAILYSKWFKKIFEN
ncbi:MAG: hypothetical protein E7262_06655 [Lachnospiraceae bacterium]|nr:hypothetical protein [Lachnospiraceae bacterium]